MSDLDWAFLQQIQQFKNIWWLFPQLHDLTSCALSILKPFPVVATGTKEQQGTELYHQISKHTLNKGLKSKGQNFM